MMDDYLNYDQWNDARRLPLSCVRRAQMMSACVYAYSLYRMRNIPETYFAYASVAATLSVLYMKERDIATMKNVISVAGIPGLIFSLVTMCRSIKSQITVLMHHPDCTLLDLFIQKPAHRIVDLWKIQLTPLAKIVFMPLALLFLPLNKGKSIMKALMVEQFLSKCVQASSSWSDLLLNPVDINGWPLFMVNIGIMSATVKYIERLQKEYASFEGTDDFERKCGARYFMAAVHDIGCIMLLDDRAEYDSRMIEIMNGASVLGR